MKRRTAKGRKLAKRRKPAERVRGAMRPRDRDTDAYGNRVPLSEEQAANVMFASDHICCICRGEKLGTNIHHIDGDPSKNAFDNLAVLCLNCHSEVHMTGGFARRRTPTEVRLYNESWREIVKLRLLPHVDRNGERSEASISKVIEMTGNVVAQPASVQGEGVVVRAGDLELASEVFLEASLIPHLWKNRFMSLADTRLPDGNEGEFQDVWDLMSERWIPQFSEARYARFKPLFAEAIDEVRKRFDRLMQLFPDILPADFRTHLIRSDRQLAVEQEAYLWAPTILGRIHPAEARDSFFHIRFVEVIRVLRDVSRDADRRRKALVPH